MKTLLLNGALAAGLAFALTVATPADAASKHQSKKKPAEHSMTGCLDKGETANTWKLTNVTGKGPKTVEIVEVASGVDLAPHVGHTVTITGTAVSTKEAAAKEGVTGTKGMKEEKKEHHMKADAVKMVSDTCKK
jgi:hypothetical protein